MPYDVANDMTTHIALARGRRERFEALSQGRALAPWFVDAFSAPPSPDAPHVVLARRRRERFEALLAGAPKVVSAEAWATE